MGYRDIITLDKLELPMIQPEIYVDGQVMPFASCMMAELKTGVSPGEAVLRFDTSRDQTSPITLRAKEDAYGYSDYPKFGSRVIMRIDGFEFWRGWLVLRTDSGEDDAVTWRAYTDQFLLSKVWLRGCLVLDPDTTLPDNERVKYVESFTPRVNPTGLWNCQLWNMDIEKYIDPEIGGGTQSYQVPVFAPNAKKVMNYETPEGTDVNQFATNGQYCAWTPRRFLTYLCAIMTKPNVSGLGAGDNGVVCPVGVFNNRYLNWAFHDIVGAKGYDPARPQPESQNVKVDPLDRKMPDINFQGMAFTSALRKTLDVTATHDIAIRWQFTSKIGELPSTLSLTPVGWSGKQTGGGEILDLQRAGPVKTANAVVGFDVQESVELYYSHVVVDGAPVKIETSLECRAIEDFSTWDWTAIDRNELPYIDYDISTLIPCWTYAQENAWKQCIYGAENNSVKQGPYALYPATPNDTDFSKFLVADGGQIDPADPDAGLRLSINSKERAAEQVASASFPMVFRAFRISSKKLEEIETLWGVDQKYKSDSRFAKLHYNRPMYAQQLQYLVHDLGLEEDQEGNWVRGRLPIRVTIMANIAEGRYIDASYQSGIRVTGDGILWMDAYGPSAYPSYDSIISAGNDTPQGGQNFMSIFSTLIKTFKINAAMPTEYRVTGDKSKVEGGLLSSQYTSAIGNPMLYVDQVDAFQELNQVRSEPTANPRWVGVKDPADPGNPNPALGKVYPITRILPPGSEQYSAEFAADRLMATNNRPSRLSSWRLPGINLSLQVDSYLEKIHTFIDDFESVDRDYSVNAVIGAITYDFVRQRTELGGLLSVVSEG